LAIAQSVVEGVVVYLLLRTDYYFYTPLYSARRFLFYGSLSIKFIVFAISQMTMMTMTMTTTTTATTTVTTTALTMNTMTPVKAMLTPIS